MNNAFRRQAFTITVASLIAAAGTTARAQDTWDGGGADNDFSTILNWLDDTAPTPATTGALIFDGVTRLTPNAEAAYLGITSINWTI